MPDVTGGAPGTTTQAEAIAAAADVIQCSPAVGKRWKRETCESLAARIIAAAAPVIAAGAAAEERRKIFATPHTQRFEVADGLLCCAGCGENVIDGRLEHHAGCSEMRLAELLEARGD